MPLNIRPLLQLKASELREYFETNREDVGALQSLLHELSHRTTPQAAALRKEVEGVLNICLFCAPASLVASNPTAVALRDTYPLSKGHTLVVPRRHVANLFDLPANEQAEVWQLVALVRLALVEQFHPDGFNIGVNDGEAAGQTVPHAHIHVIPRYRGDVADPRGGVRWVIPQKAAYWEAPL